MRNSWTKQGLIDFTDKIGNLYLKNNLPISFHLSGGNEEQLIELFKNIKEDDYVFSNHRNHYHALLHGIQPDVLEDKIVNGKSMFVYDRKRNFFCSAIIGGTPGIAVGVAWALKKKGSKKRVWCFVGDGTEDNGHLFEAIRYVDGWDLPCTFVIENNNRSVDATNDERWGKTGEVEWNYRSVLKYYYTATNTHIRRPGMIDLSKSKKIVDHECFPHIKYTEYPKYKEFDGLNLSYKDAFSLAMTQLGEAGAIFIGYSVGKGDAMGTLKNVPAEQKIETPVAENLMTGLGIGMSFEGFLPVIYYERHDFMTVAMDAIVNHIDKIEKLSLGEFKVPLIMRAVDANGGPFYCGPTHSQDFTKAFRELVSFPILDPMTGLDVLNAFKGAKESGRPAMIIERKSRY